ncbi:MAG: PSD1 and planctomycete cytochrome C domain-containing protein [Rubripirellula sp.]
MKKPSQFPTRLFRLARFQLPHAYLGVLGIGIFLSLAISRAESADRKIDFAQDVQPVLRRHCYRCHGSKNQESDLQLNVRRGVWGEPDSEATIVVKHDPDASLLIQRIVDPDYGDIMPLDADPLTRKEIDLLRRWIAQGARWPDELAEVNHWAYEPIRRPTPPRAQSSDAPVDQFISQRLADRGLEVNPMLERAQTLRRVSLALIGLPPSPEEVDAFLQDDSEDAYERAVDRLLSSPRYGERWAVPWLDLARYADSNGFQADQIRDNWAYRDWVIRAFNEDKPFDEFVVDQIAGDLLPNASVEQRIATGFHRMTTCNVEAGVHPEANRVNQVVDRVNTTATVFLGATLECAQCHDHKYDPYSQQDYYRLFAYFNNTPLEVKNTSGVTWDFYGPKMDLPMRESLAEEFASLSEKLTRLESDRKDVISKSDKEFDAWLARLNASDAEAWQTVIPVDFETNGGEDHQVLPDGSVLLSGNVPDTVEHTFRIAPEADVITAIRLDVLTDDSIPGSGPGRGDAKRTNIILNEFSCELLGNKVPAEIMLQDATADFSQKGWDVGGAIDGDRKTGWAISPQFGKPHWAAFEFANPLAFDSKTQRLQVTLGQYYGRGRVIGKPRLSIYSGDTAFLHLPDAIRKLARKPAAKLAKSERRKLRVEFDKHNPRLKKVDREIAKVKKAAEMVRPDTTLVMEEMQTPRETFVMIRGEYENLGEAVKASTPTVLPTDETIERTGDRLELARWLTSPKNPLLARVTVNRWWAQLFGTGLVTTLEDFGTQSDDPSHPLLLDWLASELIESGWSMKHVHKQIVMSDAFQRSPAMTQAMLELDPTNRYLSRGPRFRLPAESIRDNSLAISGLLSDKMYGPPIMPYQPDNIWRSVGRNQPKWVAAKSEDRFRRGAYVVWKRAAPYPSFINFDAPDRGSCSVNRGRSNTPLQALTLLNDPAYAEMALAMADRVLQDSNASDDTSRIRYAVKLAIAREPNGTELSILLRLLESERATVEQNEESSLARTKVPFAGMQIHSTDRKELAAWFAVTNALLNLDETMNQ